MQVAQWLTRRVEFSYGGRRWPLVFTHRVLLTCEELTGVNMLGAPLLCPSASLLRALLYSALLCAGIECGAEDVGHSIGDTGIGAAWAILCAAWAASMPDTDPEADSAGDEAAPQKPLTWMAAWASARRGLGLSGEEWLDMTPRQVRALREVRLEEWQREELMVGILAATFENFSFSPPRKPAKPESFMLHKLPPEPELPIGDHIEREMARFRER